MGFYGFRYGRIKKRFGEEIADYVAQMPSDQQELIDKIARLGPLSAETVREWVEIAINHSEGAIASLDVVYRSLVEHKLRTRTVRYMVKNGFTTTEMSILVENWHNAGDDIIVGLAEWCNHGNKPRRVFTLARLAAFKKLKPADIETIIIGNPQVEDVEKVLVSDA